MSTKTFRFQLGDLVIKQLDDFNFDESTVNSSTNVSVLSTNELQNKYSETNNSNEQLKILCEVRTRELTELKNEYENYKIEKSREVDNLKKKLYVYEAEVQEMKISLKNAQELLGRGMNVFNSEMYIHIYYYIHRGIALLFCIP